MKVEVYWNLHKNLWSVRHKGIVIQHTDTVFIKDAKFVVQPSGNAKVRKTKRKNVHAFVRGTLTEPFKIKDLKSIRYNPYKYTTFVVAESDKPIYNSDRVYLSKEGKCFGGL